MLSKRAGKKKQSGFVRPEIYWLPELLARQPIDLMCQAHVLDKKSNVYLLAPISPMRGLYCWVYFTSLSSLPPPLYIMATRPPSHSQPPFTTNCWIHSRVLVFYHTSDHRRWHDSLHSVRLTGSDKPGRVALWHLQPNAWKEVSTCKLPYMFLSSSSIIIIIINTALCVSRS